jgi:hypothetical protein
VAEFEAIAQNLLSHEEGPFWVERVAEVRLGSKGGKPEGEYMCSALPQVADIARSAFHRITRSGSEQFHARLWPNNATRLSGKDWLCCATRA